MTNINNNLGKSKIKYGEYAVDSFKLLIDKENFKSINIPNNFILIDVDTGEQIGEQFKKKSIQIPYGNTTIYLGVFRKVLRKKLIEKVCILFSSKANGVDYFNGINENLVKDILIHLKEVNRIDFDDVNLVYSAITVKDLDIKVDFEFKKNDKERIKKTHKSLKNYFNGHKENCKVYDNQKSGLGLQANFRDRSKYTKPFCKFYDKSFEMTAKHPDFLKTLPESIQNEIAEKFVYRFEFTIKDIHYFRKLNLSNKLQDILSVDQSTWKEIAKYYYNTNFGLMPKKQVNRQPMSPKDHVLAMNFMALHKAGYSLHEIKETYIQAGDSVNCHLNRQQKLFDKIYSYVSEKHTVQLIDEVEYIEKWAKTIGLR